VEAGNDIEDSQTIDSDLADELPADRHNVSPATRCAHLTRSTEAFTKPLVFTASKTHAASQLYQKLLREKLLEIDSEMRSRGFSKLSTDSGVTALPHASSGSRSKSSRRTPAAYEGRRAPSRKRKRAVEEPDSKLIRSKRVPRASATPRDGQASLSASSDEDVHLAQLLPVNHHNLLEDSMAGLSSFVSTQIYR
jgi:hypothetical protein